MLPDHLDFPPHLLFKPPLPCSAIALVYPHLLQARKQPFDRLHQEFDSFTILQIGSVNSYFEQQSHGIDEQMPLAARQLLGPIMAIRPAPLRLFDKTLIVSTSRSPPRESDVFCSQKASQK
jgi:hypothetical protein